MWLVIDAQSGSVLSRRKDDSVKDVMGSFLADPYNKVLSRKWNPRRQKAKLMQGMTSTVSVKINKEKQVMNRI